MDFRPPTDTAETPHPRTPAPREAGGSLLDDILKATPSDRGGRLLDRFLAEPSPSRALALWLGLEGGASPPPRLLTRAALLLRLDRDIAAIDAMLAKQLNAILHHPTFQALEASWRGLRYLVDKLPEGDSVRVKVLNLSWAELVRDQERALEFDQSQLFRKVYEGEFGHPGGEPFGLLLGDYWIRPRPSVGHPTDDVEALRLVAGVAAAAFAPFVAGVHPSFFGLDDFAELERPSDLARVFQQTEYLKWRSLRDAEDSRFVGLVLPRVLMRRPYGDDPRRAEGFHFREEVASRDDYLWGSPVYAFGGTVIRCVAQSDWPAEIRGVRQVVDPRGTRTLLDDGGLVTGLPIEPFPTDAPGLAVKFPVEVIVTDPREKDLGDLGFIPLCHCYDTEFAAFYGNPSVQKPRAYDDPKANANARLSAMLQYILCTSRFAHFVKVLGRDKIGSGITAEACGDFLNDWLRQYVTANDNAGPEVKARHPLREGRVEVRELPEKPGSYTCVIHLRPHFQLDQMFTSVKFTTELAPGRSA